MATAPQAIQQGITQTRLVNNKILSTVKYGKILNLNNNTDYSISPNSVKLLPTISNDGNYVKLYTETNMSINVGDFVYIMYDENQIADGIHTGETILDSYYEFSGCTDWIYLYQEQGYEVLSINETNNEITIKRLHDSTLNNAKLYNHYLCKIYVNTMEFFGGWIDGVCFRTVDLNSVSDTYIDIDIKQCIVLSGGTVTGMTAFYIDMRDKYDSQYVSVNSQLTSLTQKSTSNINPYKYKDFYDNTVKNPVTSFFTYNNKEYGYTYVNYTNFYNSKINNGYYKYCTFSGGTIYNGNFVECEFIDVSVQSGSFVNCTINDASTWYYGIWYGSGVTAFGPNTWYNGIWNEGIFSGKTWVTGIFNGGIFEDSTWINGIFNGGSQSKFDDGYANFRRSYWSGGTFNSGGMGESYWLNGKFNGGLLENSTWETGIFNNGIFKNSTWVYGTFNNGGFEFSTWTDGIFNNGYFSNSLWTTGTFNKGTFNTGVYTGSTFLTSGLTYKWMDGTFNGGTFLNSYWVDGIFNNGIIKNSMWSGGTFNFGYFNNSMWVHGNWNNGVVNNSVFHKVNWVKGTFNSGYMGREFNVSDDTLVDVPEVYWSGGTFNSGVFGNENCITPPNYDNEELRCTSFPSKIFWYGGDFYGGKFYTNYSSACINNPISLHTFKTDKNSGGFIDGLFHEGYFNSVYLGGHWVNGWFHNRVYNWSDQIIPFSVKYNYYIKSIGNQYNND